MRTKGKLNLTGTVFFDSENTPLGNCFINTAKRHIRIDESEANAEHLVRCWNSHEELVEALEGSLQILKQTKEYRIANNINGGNVFLDSAIMQAETALKNAETNS